MYATLLDHADTPAQLPVPAVAVEEAALVELVDAADPPEHALPMRGNLRQSLVLSSVSVTYGVTSRPDSLRSARRRHST